MFSPATVLCILVLLGCVWVQASGVILPRLLLVYLAGIEGASLIGALICSAVSINRISVTAPAETRPDPVEQGGSLSANPAAGDAQPMPPPEPMPEAKPTITQDGRVVSLDRYRKR